MTNDAFHNTITLTIRLDDDGKIVADVCDYLSDDLDGEIADYMSCLITGMHLMFNSMTDAYAYIGYLAQTNVQLKEELDSGVEFEPSEELIKALSDGKIIPFNRKKLN